MVFLMYDLLQTSPTHIRALEDIFKAFQHKNTFNQCLQLIIAPNWLLIANFCIISTNGPFGPKTPLNRYNMVF